MHDMDEIEKILKAERRHRRIAQIQLAWGGWALGALLLAILLVFGHHFL